MSPLGRAAGVTGLALILLSGCTPAIPNPSPSASIRPSSGATHLQLIEAEDAQTLDPALIDDPTSLAIGSEIFQGLTRLDANQRPVPGRLNRRLRRSGGTVPQFATSTPVWRRTSHAQRESG